MSKILSEKAAKDCTCFISWKELQAIWYLSVFLSIVRPVLEYACPVWHTNLPTYLSDSIELIQKRAMKSIYPGLSYADVLQRMGLLTLNERRELLCKLYFNKIKISSHKLNHLLPEIRNIEYDIRQCNVYPLPRTRTNSYRNSLIPWGLYNCQWVDNYCIGTNTRQYL